MGMKRGFTLIELLVVITILAILTGAALPYIQGYVSDARIAKAKTDLDEISRALAVYEVKEGDYTSTDIKLLAGRYLNKSAVDPWGGTYLVAPASGTTYSMGPDKVACTDDDLAVSYQPPLALVSAKWIDCNQSGSVDAQAPSDQVLLSFSRKLLLGGIAGTPSVDTDLDTIFTISNTPLAAAVTNMSDAFFKGAGAIPRVISTRKGILLTVKTPVGAGIPVFELKSSTIRVNNLVPSTAQTILLDDNQTPCLSLQDVFITEQ